MTTKVCSWCHVEKPLTDFTSGGKYNYCRACGSAKSREWRKNNPDKMRANNRRWNLKRHYGITPEDYDRMLAEQGGTCAICDVKPEAAKGKSDVFHVDHCHATGTIRGLLCHECNLLLGMARDDTNRLLNAMRYLNERSDK